MSHRIRNPQYLVGHWLAGGDHADDVSGYGNNGTWTGTEAYADGTYGRSVGSFDASSLITVAAADSPSLSPPHSKLQAELKAPIKDKL